MSQVLEGIQKLEYRGYDSSGVATVVDGKLVWVKEVGKISQLEKVLAKKQLESNVGIAHTRWATHGGPVQVNAHPHLDAKEQVAVVHNGIIENHALIRELLEKRGVVFVSQTDSEVIAQLIGYLYRGNLVKAVRRSLPFLEGAFAICVIHQDHPEQMVCVANQSPLTIGMAQGETFVSSDATAFLNHTRRAIYLKASEIALITKDSCQVFNAHFKRVKKECQTLEYTVEESSKGGYAHYMLKEIFEQPYTLKSALLGRQKSQLGTACLELITEQELLKIKRIVIVACGTSFHAGLLASYMLEERAQIPVEVHISSEFRYKNPIVQEDTLAIAISQSGETADTLAAVCELKAKGAKIVGLCNTEGSSLAREVDSALFLRAGQEVGVASTKAFTNQLVVLALLTLRLARQRSMSRAQGQQFIEALNRLPDQIQEILDQHKKIQSIAKAYAHFDNFFFLGRRFMYPTALEAALKLKEIAYVNANGYPAGEMKHGPIALINPSCPTVAFCADSVTSSKIISNLMEVKAREGLLFAISDRKSRELEEIVDHYFYVPPTIDELSPLLSTVVGQLFAYYVALERNTEIDQPRNLAKSVTVE